MFSIAQAETRSALDARKQTGRRVDASLVIGIVVAVGALVAGIASTGAGILYFLQPTAAAIVFGGTLGILMVTTPMQNIRNSAKRVVSLFSAEVVEPERLMEDVVQAARIARKDGMAGLQRFAERIDNAFLREALLLSLDVRNRIDLQTAIENELKLRERQGESDAKTLEVAGGFAPTVGILGTVVGLIEVLRHFTDFTAVGGGIGMAFVSTIYGLGLANLVLLPLAHRIRATVADTFERQELILEGVLCVADGLHPSMIRVKLAAFLREPSESVGERGLATKTVAAHGQ